MDEIYHDEVNDLRKSGKKVMEVSALATPREKRWQQIFMYLMQVWYWYSLYMGIDVACIAVNPRHVRFYRNLLSFEQFGEQKHYDRVDAPAVALKVDLKSIEEKMLNIYKDLDFDTNLYEYFYRMTGVKPSKKSKGNLHINYKDVEISVQHLQLSDLKYFLAKNPQIYSSISEEQMHYLEGCYQEDYQDKQECIS